MLPGWYFTVAAKDFLLIWFLSLSNTSADELMTVRVPGRCHRSAVDALSHACCASAYACHCMLQECISCLQGGIDPCENPFTAAARELLEETGIRSIEFMAQVRQCLTTRPMLLQANVKHDATLATVCRLISGLTMNSQLLSSHLSQAAGQDTRVKHKNGKLSIGRPSPNIYLPLSQVLYTGGATFCLTCHLDSTDDEHIVSRNTASWDHTML